jgi:NADH-quinone oxidoreductase subunit C
MSESLPTVPEGVRELEVIGVRQGSFGVEGSGDTSGFGGLVEPIVLPAAAQRPFGGWFDEVSDEIELSLVARNVPATDAIEKVVIFRDEITYHAALHAMVMRASTRYGSVFGPGRDGSASPRPGGGSGSHM